MWKKSVMALGLPTPEYLHQLAADNYFALNQEEQNAIETDGG